MGRYDETDQALLDAGIECVAYSKVPQIWIFQYGDRKFMLKSNAFDVIWKERTTRNFSKARGGIFERGVDYQTVGGSVAVKIDAAALEYGAPSPFTGSTKSSTVIVYDTGMVKIPDMPPRYQQDLRKQLRERLSPIRDLWKWIIIPKTSQEPTENEEQEHSTGADGEDTGEPTGTPIEPEVVEPGMDDIIKMLIDFEFDGKKLQFFEYRGRMACLAKNLGDLLGYVEDSFTARLREWTAVVKAWEDKETVEGQNYKDLKAQLDRMPIDDHEPPTEFVGGYLGDRAGHAVILFKSGIRAACMMTKKPAGIRLINALKTDFYPKLEEGYTAAQMGAEAAGRLKGAALPIDHQVVLDIFDQLGELAETPDEKKMYLIGKLLVLCGRSEAADYFNRVMEFIRQPKLESKSDSSSDIPIDPEPIVEPVKPPECKVDEDPDVKPKAEKRTRRKTQGKLYDRS